VALGGFFCPDYSRKSQFISELIVVDAPNKNMLDALFGLYNLLTIVFGVGLTGTVQGPILTSKLNAPTTIYCATSNKNGKWSGLTLIVLGIFASVIAFFTQDPIGSSITVTGMIHIILAALSSLASMLSMLCGLWFQEQPKCHAYSHYTFLSLAFLFISGGLAAFTVIPFSCSMERLTFGGFLQWLFVVRVKLFHSTNSATQ
jgi:hypothetical protein